MNNKTDVFQYILATNFQYNYTNKLSAAEEILMADYINRTHNTVTLGRYHVTYPQTGPSIIYLENIFSYQYMFIKSLLLSR